MFEVWTNVVAVLKVNREDNKHSRLVYRANCCNESRQRPKLVNPKILLKRFHSYN